MPSETLDSFAENANLRSKIEEFAMSSDKWNFHTYKDAAGQWRWRLVASNGKTVGDSGEGYSSLDAVRDAAERVKNNAGSATID